MNIVLKIVFSLSLSGSFLTLLLFFGKPVFRNKVSRQWQYYIWLIVIARLLLPFTPKVSLVGTLFQQAEQAAKHIFSVSLSKEDSILSELPFYYDLTGTNENDPVKNNDLIENRMKNSSISQTEDNNPKSAAVSERELQDIGKVLLENFWRIWLGIAVILLIRKITIYQSFIKYIRAGREEISDIKWLDWLAQIGIQMGVKRPVELYKNPLISSPFLFGFFHPCIVLPTEDLSDADFCYTIRHELTHYKRRDMFYKWLVQIVICLHWFNPLVYLMEREINRACELSCDEAVIRTLDVKERRAYGDTLLHAMKVGGNYKNSFPSAMLNKSAELLKERLGAIMGFRKTTKQSFGISLLITIILICSFTFSGAYAANSVYPIEKNSFEEENRKLVYPKESAEKVDSEADRQEESPLSAVKGDAASNFYYTQDGYYQDSYLFEIGWNVQENAAGIYNSTEISLPDNSKMTVFFPDSCKYSLENTDTFDALTALLTKLWKETAETEFPLVRPFIVNIQSTSGSTQIDLAEQYYKDGELPLFGAIFAQLEEDSQKTYLEKIYTDEKIAFFSAVVKQLEKDSPLIAAFAEKSYLDKRIDFFSVLMNYISEENLESWLVRAVQDKRVNFESVLLTALGEDQKLKDRKADWERQQIEEYKIYGITKNGTTYYYQNQPVHVFLDIQANNAFVRLERNPQGVVDIRITRDEKGTIKNVENMTAEEVEELLYDWEDFDDKFD